MQITVPGLQARSGHKAAAFLIAPSMTLITIFGGYTKELLADTTVLEFGESTCMLVIVTLEVKLREKQLHSLTMTLCTV